MIVVFILWVFQLQYENGGSEGQAVGRRFVMRGEQVVTQSEWLHRCRYSSQLV